MAEVINLPDNIIGKNDHESLESFGGHEISLGRANLFHWDKTRNGDPVFEMYSGHNPQKLLLRITRNRQKDVYEAKDRRGTLLVAGKLDHVMAVLDTHLALEHGEPSSA